MAEDHTRRRIADPVKGSLILLQRIAEAENRRADRARFNADEVSPPEETLGDASATEGTAQLPLYRYLERG